MFSDVRIDVRGGQNGSASFFSYSGLHAESLTRYNDAGCPFCLHALSVRSRVSKTHLNPSCLPGQSSHSLPLPLLDPRDPGLGSRNTRASSIRVWVCATRSLRYSSRPSLFGPEPRNWSLRFVPAITLSPGLYVRVQHGKGGISFLFLAGFITLLSDGHGNKK